MSESTNGLIPTASFIWHYVVEDALQRNVPISEASRKVLPRFGLPDTSEYLDVEARLLGMLYTLLVFPRESWHRQGLLDVVIERAQSDRHLVASNKARLTADFVRSVRNAVAHARVGFSGSNVTFTDGRVEANPTFEVTMKISETVNFLLVLGRAFHECTHVKNSTLEAGKTRE